MEATRATWGQASRQLDGSTTVTGWPADNDADEKTTPLAQVIDPARFGGALLLTSACEDLVEVFTEPGFLGDTTSDSLVVPGGVYRHESKPRYREQALLGADLIAQALEDIGIPRRRISRLDFVDGSDGDPSPQVRDFLRRLPAATPDALIYYSGPSVASGAWALAWRDSEEDLRTAVLEPGDLLPSSADPGGAGPAGNRLLVADAPGTARMWLRPALRARGAAGWADGALPGGPGGPPLARWLAGLTLAPPEGAVVFPTPPPEAGLRSLPCFHSFFWGPLASLDVLRTYIWELHEHIGAPTQHFQRDALNEELLVEGGPALLAALLETYGAAAEEPLLLQLMWVFHSLVVFTPTARWADAMDVALVAALGLPGQRATGYGGCSPAIMRAVLNFAAACAGKCRRCRAECAGEGWPRVTALVLEALEGPEASVAAAASRVVAQVASERAVEAYDDARVIDALIQVILKKWGPEHAEELHYAAAEALCLVAVRSNTAKDWIIRRLGRSEELQLVLEAAAPAPAAKLLALVRSLVGVDPVEVVVEALSPEVVDSVVHALCRHSDHAEVQRWGLAVLGALADADRAFAARAAAGGPACVAWALSADALSKAKSVEQEALFCAHALLFAGHASVGREEKKNIAGLAASAVARCLRAEVPSPEAGLWGLRILECLARARGGAPLVDPYVDVIVEAVLAPSSMLPALVAGSAAASYLAAASARARGRLAAHRVRLVKALQARAWLAAEAADNGELDRASEKQLRGWARVLTDALAETKLGAHEEPAIDPDVVEKALAEHRKPKADQDD